MRKIKFRVWHKKESRFLDPYAEEDPMLSLKDDGEGCEIFCYDRKTQEWGNQDCLMKDIVIQQSTNCVDKEGTEIYEGDILRWDGGWMYSEMIGTVHWDYGFYFYNRVQHGDAQKGWLLSKFMIDCATVIRHEYE